MTHLHVTEHGDAERTVVLLSSINTTSEIWAPQIEALQDIFRVITVDHPGHGNSGIRDAEPGSTTMVDLAQDVLAALDERQVTQFSVVGVSLGGAIAQWLAANSGRVDKAVFACTSTSFGGVNEWSEDTRTAREQGMGPAAEGFVPFCFTEEFMAEHPEKVEELRAMVLSVNPEGYAQCGDALGSWDFADQLSQITVPVLTIAAQQDQGTPPEALQEIADGVAGPVESVVLDPGAHLVAAERPDKFSQALINFL